MITITIPKTEYKQLRQYSTAYLKIVKEITKAESLYPYDYTYIKGLTTLALKEIRKGRGIEAKSVDEALAKFKTLVNIGDHSMYRK